MVFQLTQCIRSANIFIAWILAVIVVARLVWTAISIAAAADDTCSLLARLPRGTLAVTETFDETLITLAVFAFGTIILIATGNRAGAVITDTGFALEIVRTRECVTNASVFGEIRNEFEFTWTCADRFTVLDGALHVWAA